MLLCNRLPRETWMHFKSLSYQLVAYITASVAIVSHFYLEPAESPKDGSRGSPVYGATTAPGLYFTRCNFNANLSQLQLEPVPTEHKPAAAAGTASVCSRSSATASTCGRLPLSRVV
jgi:hypothetical protein